MPRCTECCFPHISRVFLISGKCTTHSMRLVGAGSFVISVASKTGRLFPTTVDKLLERLDFFQTCLISYVCTWRVATCLLGARCLIIFFFPDKLQQTSVTPTWHHHQPTKWHHQQWHQPYLQLYAWSEWTSAFPLVQVFGGLNSFQPSNGIQVKEELNEDSLSADGEFN